GAAKRVRDNHERLVLIVKFSTQLKELLMHTFVDALVHTFLLPWHSLIRDRIAEIADHKLPQCNVAKIVMAGHSPPDAVFGGLHKVSPQYIGCQQTSLGS